MKKHRERELKHQMRLAGVRDFKYTGPQKGRPRIRPNEPCPCGSKKKYKHCCRTLVDERRAREREK